MTRATVANVITGNITITALTPAIEGTEATPDGVNGSFTFTVTLTSGATTLTTSPTTGVIVATPYAATPVKRIELLSINALTVRIFNTGNIATGDMTLALSGTDADVFTLPTSTATSLAVGGETNIALTPRAGLATGVYKATLTVAAADMTSVQIEIECRVAPTGNDDIPQAKPLKAWMQNGRLHVSGLTVGSQWSVYSISGTLVYTAKATAEEADTSLPVPGIYIVVSEQRRAKVIKN